MIQRIQDYFRAASPEFAAVDLTTSKAMLIAIPRKKDNPEQTEALKTARVCREYFDPFDDIGLRSAVAAVCARTNIFEYVNYRFYLGVNLRDGVRAATQMFEQLSHTLADAVHHSPDYLRTKLAKAIYVDSRSIPADPHCRATRLFLLDVDRRSPDETTEFDNRLQWLRDHLAEWVVYEGRTRSGAALVTRPFNYVEALREAKDSHSTWAEVKTDGLLYVGANF